MKKIFLKNKLLSRFLCWLLRLKNRRYIYQVEQRKHAGLFDYLNIAKPLPRYFNEIITENNNFGIGFQLRRYVGSKVKYLNVLVEHGYFLGNYISFQERYSYASHIFTFGEVRKQHLQQGLNKRISMIGPYIHYANDYLTDKEFIELKSQLGKTLLVFLAHAASGCRVNYEIEHIIDTLEKLRNKFDTIVISLFWSEVHDKFLVNPLLEKGYKIFSAGHRYDPYFLCRLKTMIKLSDYTMSNAFGTHIAYCVYLNKPHWIYEQEVEKISMNAKGIQNTLISKEISNDLAAGIEMREIVDAFSAFSDVLTDKQIKICSKYFGLDQVKSVDEMKNLLYL